MFASYKLLFFCLVSLFSLAIAYPQQPGLATTPVAAPIKLYSKLDWSWTGQDMTVKDAAGHIFYKVHGKFWAIGQQFQITDATGATVLQSKQKIWTWKPKHTAQLLQPSGQWVEIDYGRKHFVDFQSFRTYDFSVGGEDFIATGDMFQWKFKINSKKDGVEVASVDLVGQDVMRFDWPGAQTYEINVNMARLNPAAVVSLLTIVRNRYH